MPLKILSWKLLKIFDTSFLEMSLFFLLASQFLWGKVLNSICKASETAINDIKSCILQNHKKSLSWHNREEMLCSALYLPSGTIILFLWYTFKKLSDTQHNPECLHLWGSQAYYAEENFPELPGVEKKVKYS